MIVEDRFYDAVTVPFDELIEREYERYLEEMEDEEGTPMSREDFEDWYIGAW